MNIPPPTIIGIDASLRSTGWYAGPERYGLIQTSPRDLAPLVVIRDSLARVLDRVQPETAIIENTFAAANVKKEMGDTVDIKDDLYECVKGADALVISTDWAEFKSPDFDRLAKILRGKVIFDGRNLYRRQALGEMGFTYYSVGREPVTPK